VFALLELKINNDIIDLSQDVITFIYEEVIMGSSSFLIEGRVNEDYWHLLDEFVSNPDVDAKIRWGYQDDADYLSEWHSVVADRPRYGYEGTLLSFIIEGHDLGIKLLETKTGGMYKDKRVSEIVGKIAATAGMDSTVKQTSDKYHLFQDSNDGRFMMEELLPRAYSGNYNCYVVYFKNGNRLTFEPLETSQTYTDFKDTSFGIYRGNQVGHAADLFVKYRSFDPYKRKVLEKEVNDYTAGYRQLSGSKVDPPEKPNKTELVDEVEKEKFERQAKVRWHKNYVMMHDFVVFCKDPSMPVNKLIDLSVVDPDRKRVKVSGKYVITRNRVEIKGRHYINKVFISRRGEM